MTQETPPLKTHVPLHPLLLFFNSVFNLVISAAYLCIVVFYCHFDLSKRPICWMFVRVIIGFFHFLILYFFVKYFFVWKKIKSHSFGGTTFYSIIYIFLLGLEFSWVVIGSVFYTKYIRDVTLPNFHILSLVYIIISWVELAFLPTLFLVFLIVQLQRYRRHRKPAADQTPTNKTDSSFITGGCCACCIAEGEDQCCCCRCACCEPRGVMSSYILGEESPVEDERSDDWNEPDVDVESGCCCCKKDSEIEMVQQDLIPVGEATPTERLPDAQTITLGEGTPVVQVVTPVEVVPAGQPIPVSPVSPVSPVEGPSVIQPISNSVLVPVEVPSGQPSPSPSTASGTPAILIPSSTSSDTPTYNRLHLVEAIADDGSGRRVFVAVSFVVCSKLRIVGSNTGIKNVLKMRRLRCLSCIACGLWGNRGKKMSNYNYFTFFLICLVICVVIEYLPTDNLIIDYNLDRYFHRHGIEIVYRIAYALTVSYGFMFLCTLCWPFLHHMFLLVFTLIFGVFIYVFVWGIKSNAFVSGFRNVARIASFFYLVLQAMALVDMSFTFHEVLIEKIDDTDRKYHYTDRTCCCKNQYKSFYIFLSWFFFILSVASCIALFHIVIPIISSYFIFSVNHKLCMRNIINITITLIIGLTCCFLSITEKVNRGFLAPTTFFIIIVFYLLRSLLANPDASCNPFVTYSTYFVSIIDIILVCISGCWMAYRIQSPAKEEEALDVEEGEKPEFKIPEEDGFEPATFHACMILLSLYLAMMTSAWYMGDYSIRPAAVAAVTSAFTSWVFTISIWVASIVFLYVLLIPILNTSRTY